MWDDLAELNPAALRELTITSKGLQLGVSYSSG
jgi:hypothetical protein